MYGYLGTCTYMVFWYTWYVHVHMCGYVHVHVYGYWVHVHESMDNWILGICIHHEWVRAFGYLDVWVFRCLGIRAFGYLVFGYLGIWVDRYLGTWM